VQIDVYLYLYLYIVNSVLPSSRALSSVGITGEIPASSQWGAGAAPRSNISNKFANEFRQRAKQGGSSVAPLKGRCWGLKVPCSYPVSAKGEFALFISCTCASFDDEFRRFEYRDREVEVESFRRTGHVYGFRVNLQQIRERVEAARKARRLLGRATEREMLGVKGSLQLPSKRKR